MKNLSLAVLIVILGGCAVSKQAAMEDFNKRAIAVLQPKCKNDNLAACNDLAISYQNANDHEKALKIYQSACNKGYQTSCANLANIHLNGLGVVKNESKALEIYTHSCKNGGAYSCYFLGEINRLKNNFKAAFDAYLHGCELYDLPSCTNLAALYELGAGVEKNERKAIQIYNNSCLSGENAACDNLKRLQK